MEESLRNKIQKFFAQSTFDEIVKRYQNEPTIDNLTIACFKDPASVTPFVIGILFSTVSHIVNEHYPDGTEASVVKESIEMLREYIES